MLKSNYHTHTYLCNHAQGESEDYIKKAIELGYQEIGISDHGPISLNSNLFEEKNWFHMSYETFINYYVPDIKRLKEKYKHKINILAGIEIEYYPEQHAYFKSIRDNLDYMNLAAHFFVHNGEFKNCYFGIDSNSIYSYLNNVLLAMDSKLYKIFVHPDIFYLTYKDEKGLENFDHHCEFVSRKIIEKAIERNIYLEINCSGILKQLGNKDIIGKRGYPNDYFWKIASEYDDLKVIIGVDAHEPKKLNDVEINIALDFVKKHGIKIQKFVDFNE